MNGLYQTAAQVQEFCQSRGWQFCFIGGLAYIRWAEPRQTSDVDLTILTGFQNEEQFISAFFDEFGERIENAREFALTSRVMLAQSADGTPIDASLGGLPFEENLVQRASPFEYLPGVELITASAEDMVVLKAFAGRTRDWADVEGILVRQGDALDWQLVLDELRPLCELKESPETIDRLVELRDQLAGE